jgi:hypothetical protein
LSAGYREGGEGFLSQGLRQGGDQALTETVGELVTLQLHSDSSGLYHSLGGKPVRSGDVIEVLFRDEWIKVRYEWIGKVKVAPVGIMSDDATNIDLVPGIQVRWPQ